MGYAINRIRCQVLSVSSILPALNDPGSKCQHETNSSSVTINSVILLEKCSNSEFIDNKFINLMKNFS